MIRLSSVKAAVCSAVIEVRCASCKAQAFLRGPYVVNNDSHIDQGLSIRPQAAIEIHEAQGGISVVVVFPSIRCSRFWGPEDHTYMRIVCS